jgi:hypothetical protein
MSTAKVQPQLRKLLVPAQGYQYDQHTSSCTFAPDPTSRRPWLPCSVVWHELGSALAAKKQLAAALQQGHVLQQLQQAVLAGHSQLQNEQVDAQHQHADQQQQITQQAQQQSWQDNLQLQHVMPGHRAYQHNMPEQQQPLSVVAAASVVTGQLLGLYLGYVLDDELYEMGSTPAERAYREYLHNFSVEVPPGATPCEQQHQEQQQLPQPLHQQAQQQSSSRVTKDYVLDASDCCHEDDLQHPSNPVVHVLDYRAFTRD